MTETVLASLDEADALFLITSRSRWPS